MNVVCEVCGQELKEPGALVFGPPVGNVVAKAHVCCRCYPGLCKWISDTRYPTTTETLTPETKP